MIKKDKIVKKNLLFIICLLVSSFVFSQISVSKRHAGGLKKHSVEDFEKFKSATTVFVLPDCIETQDYIKILNDVWNINDFILMTTQEFDESNFSDKNYLFFRLYGGTITTYGRISSGVYAFTYINLDFIDIDKYKKNILKVKKPESKKGKKKIKKIWKESISTVARVNLYSSREFVNIALDREGAKQSLNECGFAYNYNLGFLKNYIQKINNLISNNESYWMYKNDYSEELSVLSNKTLYIPDYLKIRYKTSSKIRGLGVVKEIYAVEDEEFLKDLMSNYNYNYNIVSEEQMDDLILSNQEIYYLTYVKSQGEKFMQIVNSKTGDIIYRNYIANAASSKNLKIRHLKDINKKIKRLN